MLLTHNSSNRREQLEPQLSHPKGRTRGYIGTKAVPDLPLMPLSLLQYFLYAYTFEMPHEVYTTIDELMNCEDIAMNMLSQQISEKAPYKVGLPAPLPTVPLLTRLHLTQEYPKSFRFTKLSVHIEAICLSSCPGGDSNSICLSGMQGRTFTKERSLHHKKCLSDKFHSLLRL